MSAMVNFYQNCPICGRSLRISIKHFGRQMSCTHCQGEFRAGKDELPPNAAVSLMPEVAVPLATPCGTLRLGDG